METQTPIGSTSSFPWKAIGIAFIATLVAGNILALNYKAFLKGQPNRFNDSNQLSKAAPDEPSQCPTSCVNKITEATRAALATVQVIQSQSVTPAPTPPPTFAPVIPKITRQEPREFYIPLGGGISTSNKDWTDMAGVETNMDSTKYPGDITTTWDATLKILSGNGAAYARLINVTDKQVLYETEINGSSEKGVRVESSPFKLTSGNKLYRVQMKSNTGYEATITSGRIKIVIE